MPTEASAAGTVKRLRLLWKIALYCITTVAAAVYFVILNADTIPIPRDHYLDYGFPFHYIELGGPDLRRAWLWPGVIADLGVILLAGLASAWTIVLLIRLVGRISRGSIKP